MTIIWGNCSKFFLDSKGAVGLCTNDFYTNYFNHTVNTIIAIVRLALMFNKRAIFISFGDKSTF